MTAPDPSTLETDRLVLRPWRDADADAYGRILSDWNVMRYWGSGLRYRVKRTLAAALASVSNFEARRALATMNRQWREHRVGLWAVEEKSSGRLIGNAGLTLLADWHADPANIEVGWMLARSAWGRGYAVEAGRASLAYAFGTLALPRIVSVTLVANIRSERVMQRLDLTRIGRTRWKRNDVVWYAMDRADWLCRGVDASSAPDSVRPAVAR